MVDVVHSSITGSHLHECKGADSASLNTVPVADGAGSTSWSKIGPSQLHSDVKNVNKYFQSVSFVDIGTAGSIFVPVPVASTLVKVTSSLQGASATADTIITFTTVAGASLGAGMTIAFTGSAGGDVDTFTPTANQSFAAGTSLKITSDGGSSSTIGIVLILEWNIN